jgi:hypothetical protein
MASDGFEFKPYLLVPSLLATAEKADLLLCCAVSSYSFSLPFIYEVYHPTGEEASETAENHEGWETISSDSQRFDVRTSAMPHPISPTVFCRIVIR